MEPREIARACADRMWDGDQVRRALGMDFVAIDEGSATLSMVVRQDMLNSHEMCHGGMIFTLADAAFAYACNSRDVSTVAQNCTVTFLAPGRLGDVLTASARETALAGRSGIYDVTVTRQDGTTIAEFRGLSRAIGGRVQEDVRPARG
ncbi:MAG: hydroxyphenylacetyl-CoA thioesterase PaaI [Beijerinckiaceae bacterium]